MLHAEPDRQARNDDRGEGDRRETASDERNLISSDQKIAKKFKQRDAGQPTQTSATRTTGNRPISRTGRTRTAGMRGSRKAASGGKQKGHPQ
jgi:hypothetical protein